MEKVTFKNSRNTNLVGNLYTSKSQSIIIMSHALANDKSERGKFDKIAESLNTIGFNVLSFDFSGCGESEDDTLTIEKQVDDLHSAIDFTKSLGYNTIGLFGHSLGGLICLKCFTKEISTIVLQSPVTNKIQYTWDKKLTNEELLELESKGYFTRTRKNAIRTNYKIDKKMLEERSNVNQFELLKNINCPVLIIQGTDDTSIPIDDTENAIKLLKKGELKIVEGADHDFNNHIDIVVDITAKWFIDNMKK